MGNVFGSRSLASPPPMMRLVDWADRLVSGLLGWDNMMMIRRFGMLGELRSGYRPRARQEFRLTIVYRRNP
jgi:hypothetical protein